MNKTVDIVIERVQEEGGTKWFLSFPDTGPVFSKSERKRVQAPADVMAHYARGGQNVKTKILRKLWK